MTQEGNGETVKFLVIGVVGLTVVGLAYFGIIRPILQAAQVIDTKEEKQGGKSEEKLSRQAVLTPTLYMENRDLITIGSGRASI